MRGSGSQKHPSLQDYTLATPACGQNSLIEGPTKSRKRKLSVPTVYKESKISIGM